LVNRPATTGACANKPTRPRGSRPWWFRVAAIIVAPLVLLGVIEVCLRLGGFGYSTSFFKGIKLEGVPYLADNNEFSWRFFPRGMARSAEPLVFRKQTSPGTRRIFVFGESAAMGDPDPTFGFSRMLGVLLGKRHPDTHFEVINLGITAINSHVIREIAAECARYPSDIWVIYMGNNEVVGPFGAGTVFGVKAPNRLIIKASLAFKRTRIGQLLDFMVQGISARRGIRQDWGGMAMFAQNKVPQADGRLLRVYHHFEANLRDIVRMGQDSGAKVLLSTVVGNLKDCAPFASLHREGLTPGQLTDWERNYQAGIDAQAQFHWSQATNAYGLALQIDPQFADLHYRFAHCCWQLEQYDQAQHHFLEASECDALRFRPTSIINEIIRRIAAVGSSSMVQLIDAGKAFQEHSPHETVGDELLYEHVHFNFHGNYLMAKMIAETIDRLLPQSDARTLPWVTSAECGQELSWTPWNQFQALEDIQRRMTQLPYTFQSDHTARLQRLEQQMSLLRPQTKPYSLRIAAAQYRIAITNRPADGILRRSYARLLESMGDYQGAVEAWNGTLKLLPHYAHGYLYQGDALMKLGQVREALGCYQEALVHRRNLTEAWHGEGNALMQLDRPKDAIICYNQALRLNPALPDTHFKLGLAFIKLGRNQEALIHFRDTLDYEPGNAEAVKFINELKDNTLPGVR
jgi:tetratricopeptide (TPR) repeat protein